MTCDLQKKPAVFRLRKTWCFISMIISTQHKTNSLFLKRHTNENLQENFPIFFAFLSVSTFVLNFEPLVENLSTIRALFRLFLPLSKPLFSLNFSRGRRERLFIKPRRIWVTHHPSRNSRMANHPANHGLKCFSCPPVTLPFGILLRPPDICSTLHFLI